ncbi:hypothetical protein Tco_0611401 [Tanacetum coccineum]
MEEFTLIQWHTDHRDPPKEIHLGMLLKACLFLPTGDVIHLKRCHEEAIDSDVEETSSMDDLCVEKDADVARAQAGTKEVKQSPIWRRESRQEDPGKDPNQQLKDAVAANKGRPIEIGFEDRADNTVSQKRNLKEGALGGIRDPRLELMIGNTGSAGKPDEYTDENETTGNSKKNLQRSITSIVLHTVKLCIPDPELSGCMFADAFARYDSGGASGSGGSRARDREDGDDTGGEDGGDDTS